MDMKQYIKAYGLRMKATPWDHNPNFIVADGKYLMDHWKVTITDGAGSSFSAYFSMGSGYHGMPPKLEDVLDCLVSDAVSVENADGFEDWAADLALDPDSRKEAAYKITVNQTEKFRAFIDSLADRDENIDPWHTLLYDVEPL